MSTHIQAYQTNHFNTLEPGVETLMVGGWAVEWDEERRVAGWDAEKLQRKLHELPPVHTSALV